MFGSREPQRAKLVAKSVGGNTAGGSIRDAGVFSQNILLAIPGSPDLVGHPIRELGSLSGKIIIDCTNPLSADFFSLTVGHTTSGAEEIAKVAKGAAVVKAFNTIPSAVLASGNPYYGTQPASVFFCGDSDSAKVLVKGLIEEIGYEAIDTGPLLNARFLEPVAELIIQLGLARGMGTLATLNVVRR
jgi:8-hydroxy-5-deazaflavin:NADPH oxidoreductase